MPEGACDWRAAYSEGGQPDRKCSESFMILAERDGSVRLYFWILGSFSRDERGIKMRDLIGAYALGDMTAVYEKDETGKTGLTLYPVIHGGIQTSEIERTEAVDGLVQLKLAGDVYNGAYSMGQTLREGQSVRAMIYEKQKVLTGEDGELEIRTFLRDARGYSACHHLRYRRGTDYMRISVSFQNESASPVSLEMLESFSLQGISPFLPGDGTGALVLHRLRGGWSQEGRLESQKIEELGLETSWAREGVRCERFGVVGSMPVNRFFPFAALEDRKNHVFWGAFLETPSSWQMEIYKRDDALSLSGGIADREFGHWMKTIAPGESFTTPEAIVTVAHTDSIDVLTRRLTDAMLESIDRLPESEKSLPILFNEYCTTWGDPSHENIARILEKIQGKGFEYFVIDCGWFRKDGVRWDVSMGDYEISETLFPGGLKKTVDMIHAAGMKAGLWFEPECAGEESDVYKENRHFLMRDGQTLTTDRRRFFDLTDPWTRDYLSERVIGTLKKYGFDYVKIDYNDEYGFGADGCESEGEKLRRNMIESYRFFEKMREEIPDLIIENCASGGHRLEPGYMKRSSMGSFSDAHECPEIPIIAACLHRAILPRQSQIWCVIRKNDSLERIAWSVISTFLGRMCLSGDVTELSEEQWKIIEGGMAFYRRIVPVIQDGQSILYAEWGRSMRHPEGWQGVFRYTRDRREAYVIIHTFEGEIPDQIEIPLQGPETGFSGRAEEGKAGSYQMEEIFSQSPGDIEVLDGKVIWHGAGNFSAAAIRLSLLPVGN